MRAKTGRDLVRATVQEVTRTRRFVLMTVDTDPQMEHQKDMVTFCTGNYVGAVRQCPALFLAAALKFRRSILSLPGALTRVLLKGKLLDSLDCRSVSVSVVMKFNESCDPSVFP